MTPLQKRLASQLLGIAADEFINHGCNDFDLQSLNLTEAERGEVHELLKAGTGDPGYMLGDSRYVQDWILMRALAGILSE